MTVPLLVESAKKEFGLTDEIERRIQSAETRLAAASVPVEHKFPPDAISRTFYGVLEASRAVLLTKDIEPKTQSGVENQVGLHFRHELGVKLLTRLRQNRQECDYGLSQPPKTNVKEKLRAARKYVEEATTVVELD
jgi:uncharacterized protein (UPF0332 family)